MRGCSQIPLVATGAQQQLERVLPSMRHVYVVPPGTPTRTAMATESTNASRRRNIRMDLLTTDEFVSETLVSMCADRKLFQPNFGTGSFATP